MSRWIWLASDLARLAVSTNIKPFFTQDTVLSMRAAQRHGVFHAVPCGLLCGVGVRSLNPSESLGVCANDRCEVLFYATRPVLINCV